MSKTTTIQTVTTFLNNLGDSVSESNFYDEVVIELAKQPWLTNYTMIAAVEGQREYALPTSAIDLRGLVYDTRWLTESRLREIEQVAKDWRDISSNTQPMTYVLEADAHLDFGVYPTPTVSGAALPPRILYDSTYPHNNFVAFIIEARTNVPAWMEWAVAFGVIAREFSKNSAHADPDGAAAASQLHQMLLAMVG